MYSNDNTVRDTGCFPFSFKRMFNFSKKKKNGDQNNRQHQQQEGTSQDDSHRHQETEPKHKKLQERFEKAFILVHTRGQV